MVDHSILLIGMLLILAGIYFAIKGHSNQIVITALILGTTLALVGSREVRNFALRILGQEFSFTLADVKLSANDNLVNAAYYNQQIRFFNEGLKNQIELNRNINNRLDRIEEYLNISTSHSFKADVANVGSVAARNGGYSVLIFYKNNRVNDSNKLKQALLDAGYQSAATSTNLSETTVGSHPANSEYIVFTQKGAAIADQIKALIQSTLKGPGNSIVGEDDKPDTLLRGDVQIYLF